MEKNWTKKISLAVMIALTLGTVACGSSSDFQSADEAVQNQNRDQNQDQNVAENNDKGQKGPSEFFNGEGGSVVSDGSFTSVTTGDGNNFACDAGGCSLF